MGQIFAFMAAKAALPAPADMFGNPGWWMVGGLITVVSIVREIEEPSITLQSLHDELTAFRHEVKIALVRLEAKIDGKPSLMAMFTGIIIVVFGMAGVIASTIGTLHTLGVLK